MSILNDFTRDIDNKQNADSFIVDQYICRGTPFIFSNNLPLYQQLRVDIARHFNVQSSRVFVVGSSKLGFSIAPNKLFRELTEESDIDVAVVDSALFEVLWKRYFDNNIRLLYRTEDEENRYNQFLQYFFRGWIRPDLLPNSFVDKREWFNYFDSISYTLYDNRKVAAAVYKDDYFFRRYHEENISTIRRIRNAKK